MTIGRKAIYVGAALALGLAGGAKAATVASGPVFSVSFPKAESAAPIDGRVLLLLSTDPTDEPRNQISLHPSTQIVFGETVDGLKPGETVHGHLRESVRMAGAEPEGAETRRLLCPGADQPL